MNVTKRETKVIRREYAVPCSDDGSALAKDILDAIDWCRRDVQGALVVYDDTIKAQWRTDEVVIFVESESTMGSRPVTTTEGLS